MQEGGLREGDGEAALSYKKVGWETATPLPSPGLTPSQPSRAAPQLSCKKAGWGQFGCRKAGWEEMTGRGQLSCKKPG